MNQLSARYTRQILLPEIGAEGQEKLRTASVLCIGAGGLGCPALLYLAAAGAGRIGIVDFDTVDETNLQRQILFTVSQLGQNKATAAKERLQDLNPEIKIVSYLHELTEKNAEALFSSYDIIIDGTDNFATKFLINDAAIKTEKPFVYGSILGFDGQLSVFNYKGGPCYRCLFAHPPLGHIPNCAEAGVIGAVAGLIGASQAMEAIKIIVGHDLLPPLSGKLWTLDMRTMETRLRSLPKNLACPVCSLEKDKIVLEYNSPVCGNVYEITPKDAQQNKNVLFIDVREQTEWEAGHIENARLIPLSALQKGEIPEFPDECEIVLYCQKGKRGAQAAKILQEHGIKNIRNMTGGYEAWRMCV